MSVRAGRRGLRACVAGALAIAGACWSQPQVMAPDVTLRDVRGGTFALRSRPAQPLLLAFLQTVPDTADTPSRSEVVFLASMAHQYGPRGLRVAVVDATAVAHVAMPSHEALLNASYDWRLEFPLLVDESGTLARRMGAGEVPTTFLLAADGRIVEEWRGLARPAALAAGIEKALCGPLAQERCGGVAEFP